LLLEIHVLSNFHYVCRLHYDTEILLGR